MRVRLIRVPYDAGNRGLRMGAGPDRLAAAADRLRARGVEVSEAPVEAPPGLRTEIGTTFALHRAVAAEVLEAVAAEAFPLVLSGNCGSAIGAIAAAGLAPALGRLRARRIHVHVDLDVHDPALAPANEFAPPDGLTPREVQDAVRAIAATVPIGSASLAAYDPSVDPDGRALEAGLQLIELFSELGTGG